MRGWDAPSSHEPHQRYSLQALRLGMCMRHSLTPGHPFAGALEEPWPPLYSVQAMSASCPPPGKLEIGCLAQALSGLNFQKFKEAVENYTFKMTKPPKNDDAYQQVMIPACHY